MPRPARAVLAPLLAMMLALLAAGAQPATAAQDGAMPDLSRIARIRLIPGWAEPDGSRIAALHVSMAPGWKTYFRNGGVSGIPPRFDWTGSTNLADVAYIWPRPHVIRWKGVLAIGYNDRLVLPIRYVPRDPALPMRIEGSVELGVCKEVCIPFSAPLSLDPDRSDPAAAELIRAALDERPRPASSLGIRMLGCRLDPSDEGARLRVSLALPDDMETPEEVVIEVADPDIWVNPPRTRRSQPVTVAETELVAYGADLSGLDLSGITVTLLIADIAAEIRGCPP